MPIEFNDGMKFDTDGEYRVEHRSDGYYVVGGRMLCPVNSYQEGEQRIARMRAPHVRPRLKCAVCGDLGTFHCEEIARTAMRLHARHGEAHVVIEENQ